MLVIRLGLFSEYQRAAKPGDRRSFNLGELRPRPHAARTTFNSRARGRGGKMKLRSIVWLLASLFVFLTPAVRAQTSGNPTTTQGSPHDQYTASISGTVFDPDGKPVAGARITL